MNTKNRMLALEELKTRTEPEIKDRESHYRKVSPSIQSHTSMEKGI